MGALLQNVFLSDFMVFIVTGVIIVLITVWANSLGEYPGYILGWLIGIFFIIIFSTLAPPAEQLPPDLVVEAQDTAQPLTFLAVLLPSIIGLASGFGALMLMRVGQSSSSRVGRSLMIAGMMGLTLGGGYLMLLTDRSTRMLIAIFVLTFAIGALLNFIISRGVTASSRPSSSRYR